MVDHIWIIWWNLKCPLRNLINWWDSLLEKLLKIPSQTRVSKTNHLQTLEEYLIKVTYEDHGDSYMMLWDIVDPSLVVLLAMRVSNPRCELDEFWWSCPTYKRVRQIQRHIFGILVSKKNDNIQVWYNHMVLGNISQNKPNERGVRRMPRCDPNANAYDEIAWGILGSNLGSYTHALPFFLNLAFTTDSLK